MFSPQSKSLTNVNLIFAFICQITPIFNNIHITGKVAEERVTAPRKLCLSLQNSVFKCFTSIN